VPSRRRATIAVDGRAVAIPGTRRLRSRALAARLAGDEAPAYGAYMVDCTDLVALRYGSPIAAHAGSSGAAPVSTPAVP
jgi:hypothetical protein